MLSIPSLKIGQLSVAIECWFDGCTDGKAVSGNNWFNSSAGMTGRLGAGETIRWTDALYVLLGNSWLDAASKWNMWFKSECPPLSKNELTKWLHDHLKQIISIFLNSTKLKSEDFG